MNFITAEELMADLDKVLDKLEAGEDFVITRNGKPFALMTATQPNRVEEDIKLIRRAHAVAALDKMRAQAKASGLDQMNFEEINAEISAVREGRDTISH
jgi:antitoxin (DNA-binding transcriptional repressor) of toxin-antitoxin stability system